MQQKNKKKEDGTVYEETEDKEKSLHSFDCGNLPVTGDIKVEVYEKSLTSKVSDGLLFVEQINQLVPSFSATEESDVHLLVLHGIHRELSREVRTIRAG